MFTALNSLFLLVQSFSRSVVKFLIENLELLLDCLAKLNKNKQTTVKKDKSKVTESSFSFNLGNFVRYTKSSTVKSNKENKSNKKTK